MIKIRLTFIDTSEGKKEFFKVIKNIEKDFNIIHKSKVYKGRGNSQYSNIYLDMEEK